MLTRRWRKYFPKVKKIYFYSIHTQWRFKRYRLYVKWRTAHAGAAPYIISYGLSGYILKTKHVSFIVFYISKIVKILVFQSIRLMEWLLLCDGWWSCKNDTKSIYANFKFIVIYLLFNSYWKSLNKKKD